MRLSRRLVGYFLRMAATAACCFGIWSSFTLARADYLFRKDTDQSVRAAIQLVPDGWAYYMRLSELDRTHAAELLRTSLQLNRYNAQADIELGLEYEAEENFVLAERQLLEAYDVDHTYLPRWSLANYYFRRDDMPAFWEWARNAAAMPADDIGSLFELCWRAAPDPDTITAAILNDQPEMIRQFIRFLIGKNQPAAVASIASHLIRAGDPRSDLPLLFNAENMLIAANDANNASALWHLLIQEHWIIADATVPNNGEFRREPLPVSFDWSLPEYDGLHSWPGSGGLETEFSGSQPDFCVIADQVISLKPGKYTLSYAYQTSDIPSGTGIRWQILDPKLSTVIAESADLSSDTSVQSSVDFIVPPEVSLILLRLSYGRTLGTTHISGMLDVRSVLIQPQSQS